MQSGHDDKLSTAPKQALRHEPTYTASCLCSVHQLELHKVKQSLRPHAFMLAMPARHSSTSKLEILLYIRTCTEQTDKQHMNFSSATATGSLRKHPAAALTAPHAAAATTIAAAHAEPVTGTRLPLPFSATRHAKEGSSHRVAASGRRYHTRGHLA
jgi:hypothetical protein